MSVFALRPRGYNAASCFHVGVAILARGGPTTVRCLADFLESLDEADQLVRISVEVDPIEEIAAITREVAGCDGPAVLFEKVRGHRLAIVSNLLGSETRVCQALSVDAVTTLQERMASLWQPTPSQGWREKIRGGPRSDVISSAQPRTVRSAPCQQIVRLGSDVDLSQWPWVTMSVAETGPSLAGALVYTVDPDSGVRHVTLCDLQMVGSRRLMPTWHEFTPAACDLRLRAARGEVMPVAIMLGGEPSHTAAAATILDNDWDLTGWTAHLRQQPLELVRCRSHDLEVPADAEMVIEGHVDPTFAHDQPCTTMAPTGYARELIGHPVLEVSAITHRNGPILPVMIGGTPRQDEYQVLGRVATRMFLPLLQRTLPEVVDIVLPFGGAARGFAAVSMRKSYAMHPRNVAGGIWSVPWLLGLKMLVLLDHDIDVHDERAVLHAVATQVDPRRDTWVEDAVSHPLNHAAPCPPLGSRIAVDATSKSAAEHGRAWPERARLSPEMMDRLRTKWAEYGLPGNLSPP